MNAFLDNGLCEDELNHGDCMFDGFDCCGYDDTNDGDYEDLFEIAPGDKTFCTECLCKGMHKFKKSCAKGQKVSKQFMLSSNLPINKQKKILSLSLENTLASDFLFSFLLELRKP